MTTWLDRYAFHTVSLAAAELGRELEAEAAMRLYAETAASKIGLVAFEGARLDADLLPFFDTRFRNVRAAFRVSPFLGAAFATQIATDGDLELFQAHVRAVNYTFIDCPPGAMPLGGDVEGKAIFLKTAQVTRSCGSEAAPHQLVQELVIGREGLTSRQTLAWNRDCTKLHVHDAETADADGKDFETMPASDLVARSGREIVDIAQTMVNLAIGCIAYAKRNAGTRLIRPMRKIPPGDRTRNSHRAHPRQTLFDMLEIRTIADLQARVASRRS